MFDVPVHVGIEHPDFVWILAALIGGFGAGFLVRAVTADGSEPVETESPSIEE